MYGYFFKTPSFSDDGSITLELHNTLSRKGSNRIKRKSMEKSQRKLQKIRVGTLGIKFSTSSRLISVTFDGPETL